MRLTISEFKEFVEMAALMSTAGMFVGVYPCSAIYAGKILKKAKPSELPVQQPTKYVQAQNPWDKLQVVMTADSESQTDDGVGLFVLMCVITSESVTLAKAG